jgi:hypothetical protein
MDGTQPDQSKWRPTWSNHAIALAGGAVGGYAGLVFVALLVAPHLYSLLDPGGFLCCGVGLVGYIPGIVIQMEKPRSMRLVGFIVAAVAGALSTGLLATALAGGAGC